MIETILKMTIKDWVAIYGALIATISFCWNIYNWYAHKGRLKVTAALVKDHANYTEEIAVGTSSRLLRIDVVNKGKEDVTLTVIGGMTKNPHWYRIIKSKPRFQLTNTTPALPHTLQATKTLYWLQEIPGFENLRKLSKIYVQDSSGKFWYAPLRDVRQMNHVLRAMKNNANSEKSI